MKDEYLGLIVARLIERAPLFRGLSQGDVLRFLARCRQLAIGEGDAVFREGDTSRLIYVILRGRIEITRNSSDSKDDPVEIFGAGQCFGEMSLADSLPRSADATASSACTLLAFSQDLLAGNEHVARMLYKNLATMLAARCQALELRLTQHLGPECYEQDCVSRSAASTLHRMEPMDTQVLAWLPTIGRLQTVATGQHVVREGSTSRILYVVMDGKFDVIRTDASARQRLATLERGHCFGEVGFLDGGIARVASVEAVTDSRVLRIEADDLQKSLKWATEVYRHLTKKLSIRLRGLNRVHTQVVTLDCRSDCPVQQRAAPASRAMAGQQ